MHFKRIKKLREKHEFTQQYVASYLNIHRVVYSRYENGVREIPVSCLINLAKLYNVTIDYLVEELSVDNYSTDDDTEKES